MSQVHGFSFPPKRKLKKLGKKLKDKAREIPEKMFCAFATTENAVKQMTLELKSLREQLMKS